MFKEVVIAWKVKEMHFMKLSYTMQMKGERVAPKVEKGHDE